MTAPTPEQRQEWRALADGATEGPWEAARDRDNWIVGDLWNGLNGMVGGFAAGGGPQAEADAAFIAAAREAVPRLLDALDAAEAEVERLRRGEEDGIFTSVVHECCERVEKAGAAIARVRALCDDAEIAVDQGRAQGHVCGPDCHCDCLAVEDVRAAADTTRPLDGEGDDQ